jgi:prepilin-type processing-associated H-X9-DG protein/prepilin-type N-terminal cleavage/methylation domain-containing protein
MGDSELATPTSLPRSTAVTRSGAMISRDQLNGPRHQRSNQVYPPNRLFDLDGAKSMNSRRSRRSSGFTLLELVVTVGIIGIVVGLLIPAVQYARAVAFRSSCQNNLHQVGLAMQQHVAVKGTFPPLWAYRMFWNEGHPSGSLSNWTPYVLPYLDPAIANMYNMDLQFYDNTSAIALPLKYLQCPSAPRAVDLVTETNWSPSTVSGNGSLAVLDPYFTATFIAAPTDYTGFTKVSDDWKDLLGYPSGSPDLTPVLATPPYPNADQIANWLAGASLPLQGTFRKPADITDGLSNSVVLVEDAGRPQLWNNGRLTNPGVVHYSGWADPGGEFGVLRGDTFNQQLINVTNNSGIYSFHADGANFAFADGSVRFLSSSTSARTVVAFLSCAAGDTPDGDY